MTNVVLNNELKGVEIYFDDKPDKSVRDNLKANGFRYHNTKVCWFAKQSENTIKLANEVAGSKAEPEAKTDTQDKEEYKNVIKKEKKQVYTLSLWDATRWTELEVNNKQGTKEMASEMRKHVRARFPMVKFSITSDYSSIDFDIVSSPFEKDSEYLKAIKEYCDNLISAYRYCTCYDPYGDYGSSYNFYGSRADIKWDYKQTEQTEEIKADMLDFDNRKAEFDKAEAERREKEYQEYKRQQEIEHQEHLKRQEEEKKQLEVINNSVNVIDLEEEKQYFVIGSEFAKLNKNNTLDEYKEEVEKGEYNLENVKITKEVHFQNEEALEFFSNMLLNDFDFLAQTGGSYTDDVRINSMTDYHNMDKEERETVVWNLYSVAIYFNNKLQFVVDAQGYSYARYAGLVDNARIQRENKVIQFINKEELQILKDKADTLQDISFNTITENNLVNTWNTESWTLYKEQMKDQFKNHNFRLSKAIIQQLPSEADTLKIAMYKLLTEVDGIQEQFRDTNLQQGQKLTLFYMSSFGGIVTSRITFESVEYTKYAQYDNNVKLTFKPEGKRKLYYNNFHSDILVYEGWLELPKTVLNDIEHSNGFTITKSKYLSCDNKQYDEILEYFNQQGIKPIINTVKPTF